MTLPTTETREVCTITVVFPVESDDAAIEYKKKINEIVAEIPDSRIDFRLMAVGKPRV